MELTELKRVLNTGELPEYNGGKLGEWLDKKNSVGGTNLGAASTGAVGVLDMAGSIGAASKFNRTADDLLRDAGTSLNNIGGVGYTVQNGLDDKQIESEVSAENTANTVGLMGKGASAGAAIGSLAGPVGGLIGGAVGAVGGLIGGLFGGSAKKREMRRQMRLAEYKRINTNSFNRSGALTTVLLNDLALTEGNQEDQVLYAASGKPFGGKEQNGWGSNGEHKIEVDNFGNILSDVRLGTGVDNKDTVPIHVEPNTIILPNKKVELPGGLKISPSRYYEQTGDLLGAEYATRMNIQNKKYKNGKLPGFKWGLPEWANAVGNVLPMINAAVDKHNIENEPISSPNTKKTNPYANIALKTMADMRFNNYLAYNDLWDTAYKYRNAANNNGNLSAAQRVVMNYAGYKDAMDSMAKLNTYGQEMNNKYAQAYAQMAAQLGEDQANRDQKAAMFDHEAYSAAHGARRLMASQRAADMASYLQNWTKGFTDMHMWRDQMGLWLSKVDADKAEQYQKAGLSPWGAKLADNPTDVSMYNYINNIQPTASDEDEAFRNSYFASQPKKLGSIAQDAADKKAYQDKIASLIAPSFPTLDELIKARKNIGRRKFSKKK